MTTYTTGFDDPEEVAFFAAVTRVSSADGSARVRHHQVASLTTHAAGVLMITARWDDVGTEEGDASNRQALYLSHDGGRRWRMANRGEPIVTLKHGTSFGLPSAITHSFVFVAGDGATWLYYTVNQPYTWGPGRPDRSTGGGEIRRVLLEPGGDDWRAANRSDVVWGFQQPAPDPATPGGTAHDIRMACLNGILRLRDGSLLMPVAGRATVPEPEGAFWRLDRCWVLRSTDGGASWPESVFVGGGPSLCLCEPTLEETSRDGAVVAYMRSQYGTGTELYRSDSQDGGSTWTHPRPTGLPNAGGFGSKPFLRRLGPDRYGLLQTYEHDRPDRTNLALFLTDEAGLREDVWPTVRVLSAECRRGWLGSAYGWLEPDTNGDALAAWVSFAPEANHLNFARLGPDWLERGVVEPMAVWDAIGNDLPYATRGGLHLPTTRSRAHAPHYGRVSAGPHRVHAIYRLGRPPASTDLPLLEIRSRNGHDRWCSVGLRPGHSATVWFRSNRGWWDSGIAPDRGGRIDLELDILDRRRARVRVNGMPFPTILFARSDHPPTTLWFGGGRGERQPITLTLVSASYGAERTGERA